MDDRYVEVLSARNRLLTAKQRLSNAVQIKNEAYLAVDREAKAAAEVEGELVAAINRLIGPEYRVTSVERVPVSEQMRALRDTEAWLT